MNADLYSRSAIYAKFVSKCKSSGAGDATSNWRKPKTRKKRLLECDLDLIDVTLRIRRAKKV